MGKLHMLRRPRFRRRLLPTLVALITALYTGPFASALGDVEQRTLRVSVGSSVVSVTALCVEPANAAAASSTPLLMLHGASFSAHTWAELNTLQTLSGTGPHSTVAAVPRSVCAVDSPRTRGHQGDVLVGVLDALGWKRAFVVAPSASGRMLWPLLLSESAFRRVAGAVPVAAVGFDAYSERLATSSAASSTPMLVVIGSRDTAHSASAREQKATFARSRIVSLPDAGHACYLDAPELFHKEVSAWMESVEDDAEP